MRGRNLNDLNLHNCNHAVNWWRRTYARPIHAMVKNASSQTTGITATFEGLNRRAVITFSVRKENYANWLYDSPQCLHASKAILNIFRTLTKNRFTKLPWTSQPGNSFVIVNYEERERTRKPSKDHCFNSFVTVELWHLFDHSCQMANCSLLFTFSHSMTFNFSPDWRCIVV